MWSCSTGVMLNQNMRGLAEVVGEGDGGLADLARAGLGGSWAFHVSPDLLARPEGASTVERVRPVRGDPGVHRVLVVPVAQHVVDLGVRPVDGELGEVGTAEPGDLGVQVGEQPGLQERVVGDVDPGHEMADVEGDLLGLGEEVGGHGGEGHPADDLHGRKLLRDELRGVEQVDPLELLLRKVGEHLDGEVPLRDGSRPRWRRTGHGGGSPGRRRHVSCASSQVSECTPSTGFQWNLTRLVAPSAATRRKVCTPNPSIIR